MKTRLARGCTGTQFYRRFSKADRRAYTWAINVTPGTIINSFDAWNHEVSKVEIVWQEFASWTHLLGAKTNRARGVDKDMCLEGRGCAGEFVWDVVFTSTEGWSHHISETGCIVPAFTREALIQIHSLPVFEYMERIGVIDAAGVKRRESTQEERVEIERLSEGRASEWPDCLGPPYPPLRRHRRSAR